MTTRELLEAMAPFVAPTIVKAFGRRDLCILTARIVVDVGQYFGVDLQPLPVRVLLYNAAYDKSTQSVNFDPKDPSTFISGAWNVGIGFDTPKPGKWNGHLIVVGQNYFGDFSIQQGERLDRNILTGPAIVGPYHWREQWGAVENTSGTIVEYQRIVDDRWKKAPDWRTQNRRRPIVASIIRELNK
jgi:hypothetical protein